MTYSLHALPYPLNAHQVFELIRPLGNPILFDSAQPQSLKRFGRYDIVTAAPDKLLRVTEESITLTEKSGQRQLTDDPFAILNDLLSEIKLDAFPDDIPFCGGLAGFFSYDLGRHYEKLPSIASNDIVMPEMRVGRYLWAVVIDHELAQSHFIELEGADKNLCQTLIRQLHALPALGDIEQNFEITQAFSADISRDQYLSGLQKTDDYIHAGDCYQINYTQRFNAQFEGDPWTAFRQLRREATTPFSVYTESEDGAILSLSPERFLQVSAEGAVETRPIKGTMPRFVDAEQDQQSSQRLTDSRKDQAENMMIVDLMRNDLSKVCEPNSVDVPELFSIEAYPNVHHMVSSIVGKLAAPYSALDLLHHCFPGGSITGAPKIRAMEIIDELEPHRRSIYCGSLGYVSASGAMDTNIAIRTILAKENKLYCWAGGGITADSIPEAEYQESLDKIGNLIAIMHKHFLPEQN